MIATKTSIQRLRNNTRYLGSTLEIYGDALSFINTVAYREWGLLEYLASKERINAVERMVHATEKNNSPEHPDFDRRFYKFPGYLRRAVIAEAIGHVSSHMTALAKWRAREEKAETRSRRKKKARPPSFNPRCNSFPVFYRGDCYKWIKNGKVALKLFTSKDWIWFVLPFEPVDIENRFSAKDGWERKNPMVVNRGKRWRIHFPFEKKAELKEKDFTRPVCSVDLGLNHTATVSIVNSDGTVVHREFIDYGAEKDRLKTTIGHIAVKGRQTWLIPEGERFCKHLWNKIGDYTDEIAHRCSREIVNIAVEYNCQAIVFEHLGRLKIPKGVYGAAKLRRKFHYFLRGRIQKYARYKAHAEGMRFSRVLARGTSENAYDGSGTVRRVGNRQVALFRNGKRYNSDLSASYNIGARYWIRELPKSLAGNSGVAGEGESPFMPVARHQQTLASLISLARTASHGGGSAHAPYSGQGSSLKREIAIIASA